MYEQQRDEYASHRGTGCFLGLIWLGWVLATVVGFLVGEWLGEAVQNFFFPPAVDAPRLLSLEGNIQAAGALQYFSSFIGGLVAGAVLGVAQGLILLPFLKGAGFVEWVAATTIGRMASWLLIYVFSRELIGLTLDRDISGMCFLF